MDNLSRISSAVVAVKTAYFKDLLSKLWISLWKTWITPFPEEKFSPSLAGGLCFGKNRPVSFQALARPKRSLSIAACNEGFPQKFSFCSCFFCRFSFSRKRVSAGILKCCFLRNIRFHALQQASLFERPPEAASFLGLKGVKAALFSVFPVFLLVWRSFFCCASSIFTGSVWR